MAITYRRGWWKPWNWSTRTWVLAMFATVVISPLATRWICLWRMPDVALPFDMEEVIEDEVSRGESAFVGYVNAAKKSRDFQTAWSTKAVEEGIAPFDEKWDDRLDQWLISNGEVLEEFRRSSELKKAGRPSLKTMHYYWHITSLQELRQLTKLSEANAIRCERADDLEAAWIWHRATLRSARHAELHGFIMACFFGNAIRNDACQGIARWATQPSLAAEQLRSARSEIALEIAKRNPPSEAAKVDYQMIKNTLELPEAPDLLVPDWNFSSLDAPHLLVLKRLILWTIGQPELSLRLSRQLLMNQVNQIDLPLHLRQKVLRAKQTLVFELDPAASRPSGQLDPAQLDRKLDTSLWQLLVKADIFAEVDAFDFMCRMDNARSAAINVLLAAQEYQRIHGEFPAKIEQLVPTFLEAVPFDPMDASGAPLRYRREANGEAVVWSIGRDAQDEGGDVEGKEPKDLGYRIFLKKLTDDEATKTDPATEGSASETTK